ncbi:hypothetical protein EMIT040CA3_10323 [Bacillus pseudomycoides]
MAAARSKLNKRLIKKISTERRMLCAYFYFKSIYRTIPLSRK